MEDKLVQMGIKKILEAIFEVDFIDVSFGFQPNRNCHDTLDVLDKTVMTKPVNYVVDMDIEQFFDFLGFTHYCNKTRRWKFKLGRKTASSKHRQKIKAMNLWMKKVRNQVKLKEWWEVLKIKLLGHYRYYGISGNIQELRKFYIQTSKPAYKWINRRSQKKSYTYDKYCRFKKYNPFLPEPKIYHLTYTLFLHRGSMTEEPCASIPVR